MHIVTIHIYIYIYICKYIMYFFLFRIVKDETVLIHWPPWFELCSFSSTILWFTEWSSHDLFNTRAWFFGGEVAAQSISSKSLDEFSERCLRSAAAAAGIPGLQVWEVNTWTLSRLDLYVCVWMWVFPRTGLQSAAGQWH